MSYRLSIGIASADHSEYLAEFNVEMIGDITDDGIPEIKIGGVDLEIIDVNWSLERPPEQSIMRLVADAYDSDPKLKLAKRERVRRFSGPRCYVRARADRRHMVALARSVADLDQQAAQHNQHEPS